jgi:hypothetical protein
MSVFSIANNECTDVLHRAPDAAIGSSAMWSWATMGGVSSSLVPEAVMAIVCVGVNLATNVIAIYGIDDADEAAPD